MKRNPFVGEWKIVETDLWESDYFDEAEPARIEINSHGGGTLVFGYLGADIDYRIGQRGGDPTIEFSWEGLDEGTPICGRGWGMLADADRLDFRIYIHNGDESGMVARRGGRPKPTGPRRPKRSK